MVLVVLCALAAVTGPAQAASTPLVELVQRFVPEHSDLDAARIALSRATEASGPGSPASRSAARAYAAESDLHAGRTAAIRAETANERSLRDAMVGANRALSADLREYADGAIDATELDRRAAEGRERAAAELAQRVAAVASDEGLDESVNGLNLARGMAPVILLIIGVVGLGAFTRRGSAAPRSRRS